MFYTACNTGLYGTDCKERCGNCLDVYKCSYTNGACLTGCVAGYQGNLCKTRELIFHSIRYMNMYQCLIDGSVFCWILMSIVINLYCHTLLVDAMVIYVPFSDATFFRFCFCLNIEKHKSNKNTHSLLKPKSLSIVTIRPIYIYVGLPRTPTPYNDLFLGEKYNV